MAAEQPTTEADEAADTEADSGFEIIAFADTLDDFLNLLDPLVDECKVRIDSDGLRVTAVDPANVGMVDITLPSSAFEAYNAGSGEGIIGLPLERFEDVIGLADSDDLVQIRLNSKTRKLEIESEGVEYTLTLIDPKNIREEPDIPDLGLPAEVIIEGADLDRGVRAADMVSDHIALGVDDESETFIVDAQGDTDDVRLEIERDELINLESGEARSLFSLDYLADMSKAIPDDAEVTLELGEEFPVKIHLGIADGKGEATYLLAPRIQSDDGPGGGA